MRSAVVLLALCAGLVSARAALQFDVFLGYDGIVAEGSWFPVVCEVKNDGPPFTATVEVEGGDLNKGQARRAVVELPTGTLKRFVIPVFSSTRNYSTWDVRLLDERGKVRAEQTALRPRKQLSMGTLLMGAITRTAGGTPELRSVHAQQAEQQPASARLLTPVFPDNPLVLEGLSCLYLNSEKATELSMNQVNALFGWLHAGGHLIIGIEQITEVEATPWLKGLVPCDLKEMRTVEGHPELQAWLRSAAWPTNFNYPPRYRGPVPPGRPPPRVATPPPQATGGSPFSELPEDLKFEGASLQVAAGEVREGRVEVATRGAPLIVSTTRGRGRVTVLLFSPEREPFRSWKNLPTFWARVAEVPASLYASSDYTQQGGWGSDGIFGAMIDTRQVHKLPVGWLLMLLIVYLVVIGPLDQFWLKRIGKPMLTWITFPCYVVLFSLVIYFIGYRLRAGESEWSDLHLVDVLANGERAELRGRTYASVYSPSNQRYLLESPQKYATLRGEYTGGWGGGQSYEKANVMQNGDSFRAEIFVPVWTSQLFVSDWWHSAPTPVSVTVTPKGEGWVVKAENHLDQKLTKAQIVMSISSYDDYVIPLGDLGPEETKTFEVTKGQGMGLQTFVGNYGGSFLSVVQNRQRAFGASESGRLDDLPNCTVAASFLSQLAHPEAYMQNFISSPGLDMTQTVKHGNAVLFAWAAGYSPVKPMYRFTPRRAYENTMFRVSVPVQ